MSSFFAEFTYSFLALAMCLLAFLLWLGGLRGKVEARRSVLIAAVIGWPFGLFSFENIPKYWDPRVTLWLGPASLEDLVFVGGSAALAWGAAILPFAGRMSHKALSAMGRRAPDWPGILLRFVIGAAPGIALAYALGLGISGTRVITATLWGYALGGAILLWLKRRCWPLMLGGSIGYAACYLISLALSFKLWPGFKEAWHNSLQPHSWWLGLPVHEYLWALGFGTVWPLFVAWCLDSELTSIKRPREGEAG